jgi:hypothetical protein
MEKLGNQAKGGALTNAVLRISASISAISRAIYVNCTLKRSPEPSHTQLLMDKSIAIMPSEGILT